LAIAQLAKRKEQEGREIAEAVWGAFGNSRVLTFRVREGRGGQRRAEEGRGGQRRAGKGREDRGGEGRAEEGRGGQRRAGRRGE